MRAWIACLLSLSAAHALAQAVPAFGQPVPAAPHVLFRVTLSSSVPRPVSGRVLIFVKLGSGDSEVTVDEFHPQATWVTAREVHDLAPGATVEVDGADLAFPASFATMPPGSYEAQAVLDPGHTYNYSGRGPEDWISPVVPLPNWSASSTPAPVFTLDAHPPENPRMTAAINEARTKAKPGIAEEVDFESPALSHFWGRPTSVKAWVILPPGYADDPKALYPTVYWTHGFGGNLNYALQSGLRLRRRIEDGSMPPMIWVMLDESCPQGTHEFVDSINDGPWGTALITEFIPELERRYRMDAKPTGRLLNGHSSGGWATLQLQINHPEIFGGTWSTSPDPSDFHDFTNVNLYEPNPNFYHSANGTPYPIMRDKGKVLATLQQFSQLENVLGPWGGQIRSFDWVFSPRATSGEPARLFDIDTGVIDREVAAYWIEHYELAHILESTWAARGPALKGRIHLIVGTADTFYLDGSAHRFEAGLAKLDAGAHFTYLPDRTHFDLYQVDKDSYGLFDRIGAEMYAVARPGFNWQGVTWKARK